MRYPRSAAARAVAAATVVLPTPPLPVTRMILNGRTLHSAHLAAG